MIHDKLLYLWKATKFLFIQSLWIAFSMPIFFNFRIDILHTTFPCPILSLFILGIFFSVILSSLKYIPVFLLSHFWNLQASNLIFFGIFLWNLSCVLWDLSLSIRTSNVITSFKKTPASHLLYVIAIEWNCYYVKNMHRLLNQEEKKFNSFEYISDFAV